MDTKNVWCYQSIVIYYHLSTAMRQIIQNWPPTPLNETFQCFHSTQFSCLIKEIINKQVNKISCRVTLGLGTRLASWPGLLQFTVLQNCELWESLKVAAQKSCCFCITKYSMISRGSQKRCWFLSVESATTVSKLYSYYVHCDLQTESAQGPMQ